MIALYVDDIPAAYNDTAWLTLLKAMLGARFKIKDLGDLFELLGMRITRDGSLRSISVDHSKYMKNILAKHNMTDCKLSSLPIDPRFLSGLAHTHSPHMRGKGRLS
jgi:hypothetical protein